MKRAPTREQRRAARLILDAAKCGEPISADAITDALGYSGDLPLPEDADDYDLLPVRHLQRAPGEWERANTLGLAPETWICGLPH